MRTKIKLEGVHFYSFHGFYEEERLAGNNFIINTEVETKTFDSLDDNIKDTVNYEQLFNICKEEMARTQKLLETVALNIITRYKNELNHVTAGSVTIKKVGPQLGGKVEFAIVEQSF